MYLKLRIIFTILSVICLAVIITAAVWLGPIWLGVFGGGAALFFVAMLLCKQAQESADPLHKEDEADFITPKQEETDKK